MPSRWQDLSGDDSGDDYAARFAELAASGKEVHGEATFCAALVAPPARVLDAGCGTGRVAIRLAELGYDVIGLDADESMLTVARRQAPELTWLSHDLAELDRFEDHVGLAAGSFDLVVLAGNVVPLLAEGTLTAAVSGLARQLRPGGLLVAGFGLDQAHLPRGCPVTPWVDYDAACVGVGLTSQRRLGTWDGAPFEPAGGYVVSVHASDGPG